ncbi:uncharacterized protein M421DRAFT_95474 [Didymella exigua CBS 183.55]|uniref:Uncharacterized protein n=1 Tax=Didymella exigua CBS 183.55 TaxID=1150837 RepID=A0A6A5RAP0_9PLEO|nr:uncharacterized protein M421DRAFT_95474 [Didymella exigua CBS 183.55]KAF1924379.1 hypothetical protein M421DRAFT_95474 [Didymella exigua CBS 183.55]
MRAKHEWSCSHPSSGMQLALPRPITPADERLPFTKSLATALEPAAQRLDVSPAHQLMGDTLRLPASAGPVAQRSTVVNCSGAGLPTRASACSIRRLLDPRRAGWVDVNSTISDPRRVFAQSPQTDGCTNNGHSVAGRIAACIACFPPMPGCLSCSCRARTDLMAASRAAFLALLRSQRSHHGTDSVVASVEAHHLSFHSLIAVLVVTNRAVSSSVRRARWFEQLLVAPNVYSAQRAVVVGIDPSGTDNTAPAHQAHARG